MFLPVSWALHCVTLYIHYIVMRKHCSRAFRKLFLFFSFAVTKCYVPIHLCWVVRYPTLREKQRWFCRPTGKRKPKKSRGGWRGPLGISNVSLAYLLIYTYIYPETDRVCLDYRDLLHFLYSCIERINNQIRFCTIVIQTYIAFFFFFVISFIFHVLSIDPFFFILLTLSFYSWFGIPKNCIQ